MPLPYTSLLFWMSPMILAIISELSADFLGKKWTLKNKQIFLIVSLSLYVIGNIFWILSVFYGVGIGRGAVVFAIGQQIAAISIGIFYFKEKLNSKQLFGAVLGLITIVIMGAV
jgi:glucose uptake protein GlcU